MDGWKKYKQEEKGLASYRVWDVFVDATNAVWCAFVLAIAQIPDGTLWFATAQGVSSFAGEKRPRA
ncbi:MAG: hypothetical protein A2487_07695 [Candidatus Raymondbacteria bacterium RifOxyC12_full_50_8]|uniref:Uncharacterized protein n=1 Tax=Candidatus Raymondbacteria bacterium RIFOXYD12_FULL_49_13 TaxID=1817890 RepID=A0A1F7F6X6_UNCRA|nr:MAG: hypothetical protein A2248_13265 [Candidatus Raymondbacteria bacterium RIFOXYA2_FULL_49_16]OGJ96067.1 MAG: hypothetical protein A2350_04705 [Candidatus Raymondbacteria bacterium RifOxyB12_full_50_8]OGJ99306.1 MAG: hypothetical protein A2487_07695 [Candidatus Raymondbacteria bacterium RifOxyC12_full_50_8]OGK02256.1 MAG: hypothetical protein A2519_16380 [Candidatus Raymondbacteria bacterium RIFOXYD12_FULL_49_13]OGP45131.1 MAG: hypothetical protein A2324_12090 [Candidatus Raymondbacteria b